MIPKKINLSLIIPCFNESENLPILIKNLLEIESEFYEIILVNNGSTDNTNSVANDLIKNENSCIKILDLPKNNGYGYGIKAGLQKASGEIIAWTHADLQTDPKDVAKAFQFYIKNKNYKKCLLKGKRIGRGFFDNLFTLGMGVIASIALNIRLSDINAQPKMFHSSFLKNINDAPDDFSLDLFMLYEAVNNNYSILEYPVHFSNRIFGDAKGGGTFLGKFRLIVRTFSYIKRLRGNIKR